LEFKILEAINLQVFKYGCGIWSLSLKCSRTGLPREYLEFGPKREEIRGDRRKFHNEELHSVYLHQILLGCSNQGG
jgi:hypothetical protein